jgi:hypothetical protein
MDTHHSIPQFTAGNKDAERWDARVWKGLPAHNRPISGPVGGAIASMLGVGAVGA